MDVGKISRELSVIFHSDAMNVEIFEANEDPIVLLSTTKADTERTILFLNWEAVSTLTQ
jgi:hypothetical protein